MIHTTIGLYANGSYKINGVRAEDLEDHVEYNKTFRFGRSLFVDGKCVHKGYQDDKAIKEFEERIVNENLIAHKCTMPYV